MPLLNKPDWKLSMQLSPRARRGETTELRSLLVHRLRSAAKAVLRLPLQANIATATAGAYTVHCEPCARWFTLPDWGEEIRCDKCRRLYALEFAVFSEIKDPVPAAEA
jgi:hypothetical protein